MKYEIIKNMLEASNEGKSVYILKDNNDKIIITTNTQGLTNAIETGGKTVLKEIYVEFDSCKDLETAEYYLENILSDEEIENLEA